MEELLMKRVLSVAALAVFCMAGTLSAANVLAFEDYTVGTSALPGALALWGGCGVCTITNDSGTFNTDLTAGGWDVVIYAEQNNSTYPSSAAELTAYVGGGGGGGEPDRQYLANGGAGWAAGSFASQRKRPCDHDQRRRRIRGPRRHDQPNQSRVGHLFPGMEPGRRRSRHWVAQQRRLGDHPRQRRQDLSECAVDRHLFACVRRREADCQRTWPAHGHTRAGHFRRYGARPRCVGNAETSPLVWASESVAMAEGKHGASWCTATRSVLAELPPRPTLLRSYAVGHDLRPGVAFPSHRRATPAHHVDLRE